MNEVFKTSKIIKNFQPILDVKQSLWPCRGIDIKPGDYLHNVETKDDFLVVSTEPYIDPKHSVSLDESQIFVSTLFEKRENLFVLNCVDLLTIIK